MTSAEAIRAELDSAAAEVGRRDPVLAEFIKRAGPAEIRPGEPALFDALCRAIVFQQLATRAASTIHGRFLAAVGEPLDPARVLATPPQALRSAGLSTAKTAAILDLASKVSEGEIPVDDLDRISDDEVVERLTRVRGIGRWTAEMYLMFNLRRPDVWPVDDLGVRTGYGLIFGRPGLTARELMPEGDRFRPHRSVVAWYCWQAVHMARGHD